MGHILTRQSYGWPTPNFQKGEGRWLHSETPGALSRGWLRWLKENHVGMHRHTLDLRQRKAKADPIIRAELERLEALWNPR